VGLASLEQIAAKLREQFLFEVIFGINFLVSQPQSWELPNKEGWRFSWPWVVLFVSYGDYIANFHGKRNDT